MAIFLDCLWLYQLAATTQLQVDQTCPMGYIFAYVFSQRILKDLNQLYTSMMDIMGERFEGIVPSNVKIQ